jgi:hypothetical protein
MRTLARERLVMPLCGAMPCQRGTFMAFFNKLLVDCREIVTVARSGEGSGESVPSEEADDTETEP